MKLIICGGRNYHFTESDIQILNDLHRKHKITEVVSGACRGADQEGECWAKLNDIPVKQFMPAWDDKGSAAGPIRNQAMANYAEACICFPGGHGTQDMKRRAEEKGLITFEVEE